ncbi:MAG: amidase family protein [Verrucomicrobia bacterium]|nr:amidase family protein [Verrucomicrobiota bacterium]
MRPLRTLRLALCAFVIGHSSLVILRAAQLDLSTATIADLQAAMAGGALTSEKLVSLYLARIAAYDQAGPKLNTVITLNAKALETARALDAERRAGKVRGPLHGIVVLAKDVFDTADLPTTGGFLPMATSQPSRDAFIIERLRAAGAIVLAKLNMSDWYGVAPRGASTLKGQVLSPYNLAKFPGSSSSGTGASMAAWFGTVGLGSDTGGSITIPTAQNNLAGFSTTHGLVSRTGQMWSSPRQENGGPMGRSVYDCAAVLNVIAGYDAADLATEACVGRMPDRPYTSFVTPDGLKGARIGVLREMVRTGPGHAEGVALFEQAVADAKKAGALIIDPVRTGLDLVQFQADAAASSFEVVAAINKYLAALPPTAPIRTVDEMVVKGGKLTKPGIVSAAKETTPLERSPGLIAAYRQQDAMRTALNELMDRLQLDALILPFRTFRVDDVGGDARSTQSPDTRNTLSSYTGLPTIVVPGGFFPADGMPFGVQFLGRAWSEPTLIKLASGYEATTHHRRAPALTPALPGETIKY